ncbi:hypothetical protein A3Q56_01209 [Intoshia linei]|uniref:G-protein coupled receptors family 1 profile domain-containing protein n=1 Tax=Intoshia linei TaxID=1819745 RepID=A0A177B9J9_9BILA|nr:hypothetical protein A3Q56_01209 [Intoshia linei]
MNITNSTLLQATDTILTLNDTINALLNGSNLDSGWLNSSNIITQSLLGFDILIGLIFNIITLCILVSVARKKRLLASLFYINIAIANIILIALSVPFMVYQYSYKSWMYGGLFCKFFSFIRSTTLFVIAFTLVGLSFFKCMINLKSKTDKYRKKFSISMVILSIWIICGLLNFQTFIVFEYHTYSDAKLTVCRYYNSLAAEFNVFFHVILGFIIPSILLVIFQIIGKLRRKKKLTSDGQHEKSVNHQNSLLFAQTICFICTQLPITLYISIYYFGKYTWNSIIMKVAIGVLTISLSFPIIFSCIMVISNDIKFEYYKMFNNFKYQDSIDKDDKFTK